MNLPDFKTAKANKRAGTASALETFIARYQPIALYHEWRDLLVKVLEENSRGQEEIDTRAIFGTPLV